MAEKASANDKPKTSNSQIWMHKGVFSIEKHPQSRYQPWRALHFETPLSFIGKTKMNIVNVRATSPPNTAV
jgi:hypothetical protein